MRQVTRDRVAKQRERAEQAAELARQREAEARHLEEASRERAHAEALAKAAADVERERRAAEATARRQAEADRLAKHAAEEEERHRTRPITILSASRWLGESPLTTLARVRHAELPLVRGLPGDRVRACDVEALILADARRQPPVYHHLAQAPLIAEGQIITLSDACAIFAVPIPEDVDTSVPVAEAVCPKCSNWLEEHGLLWQCLDWSRCGYQAVRAGDTWRQRAGWFGVWAPPRERERQVRKWPVCVRFAQAPQLLGVPQSDDGAPSITYPAPPPPPARPSVAAPRSSPSVYFRAAGGGVGPSYRSRFERLMNEGT
jgi:hypothetical protein